MISYDVIILFGVKLTLYNDNLSISMTAFLIVVALREECSLFSRVCLINAMSVLVW